MEIADVCTMCEGNGLQAYIDGRPYRTGLACRHCRGTGKKADQIGKVLETE